MTTVPIEPASDVGFPVDEDTLDALTARVADIRQRALDLASAVTDLAEAHETLSTWLLTAADQAVADHPAVPPDLWDPAAHAAEQIRESVGYAPVDEMLRVLAGLIDGTGRTPPGPEVVRVTDPDDRWHGEIGIVTDRHDATVAVAMAGVGATVVIDADHLTAYRPECSEVAR